jgi:hypothetical protein
MGTRRTGKGKMIITNQVFEDIGISIDGDTYIRCTFKNCTLNFSGALPVNIHSSVFTDCHWNFLGSAQVTINFLLNIYHNVGKELIEQLFSANMEPRLQYDPDQGAKVLQ